MAYIRNAKFAIFVPLRSTIRHDFASDDCLQFRNSLGIEVEIVFWDNRSDNILGIKLGKVQGTLKLPITTAGIPMIPLK